MELRIHKDRFGVALMDGGTACITASYLLSLNHLGRIQDVGYEIQFNKKSYHSSLSPMVNKFMAELDKEINTLNKQFRGKSSELFHSNLSLFVMLPHNEVSV